MKKMADQGIVKLDTDDDGNQVLSVPWWNQKPVQEVDIDTEVAGGGSSRGYWGACERCAAPPHRYAQVSKASRYFWQRGGG